MQSARSTTGGARLEHQDASTQTTRRHRWVETLLSWLVRYWDDPELRTGFWRSGW